MKKKLNGIYIPMFNSENTIITVVIILSYSTLYTLLEGLLVSQSYLKILWWNSTCDNYALGLSPVLLRICVLEYLVNILIMKITTTTYR